MRAAARIEHRIIFEDDDRGFDRVQRVPAVAQHAPARPKRAQASRIAGISGFIGDVPRTAMNDQRGSHEEGEG